MVMRERVCEVGAVEGEGGTVHVSTEGVAEMGVQGMAPGWRVMMLSERVGEKAVPRRVRMVPPEWGPKEGA